MKTQFLISCLSFLAFSMSAETQTDTYVNECGFGQLLYETVDSTPVEVTGQLKAWTVFGEDGSIRFSEETIQLMKDTTYRSARYPMVYTLSQVPELLQDGDVPFALWTLINLFPNHPEKVRTIAFMLAEQGIQAQYYLNAFYTYGFTDPEVFHFMAMEEPYLENPQRMEEKLRSCRTLAAYTDKYLEMDSGGN